MLHMLFSDFITDCWVKKEKCKYLCTYLSLGFSCLVLVICSLGILDFGGCGLFSGVYLSGQEKG